MTVCACPQAVVLVGGEGTRLRPITSRVPKPVAPVLGRPFITYILENLVRHGVERVVFSAGFLAGAIEAEVGDGSRFGLDARYVVEDTPLGTAGAIKNAQHELGDGCFLAFNGDVLTDVDLTALVAYHKNKGGLGTILLTPVEDPRRYGLVELGKDGEVAEFLEKPGAEWVGSALINAGVYVLEQEVLEMVPSGRFSSIERGVFPGLAALGSLFGFTGASYWRDIGTPESYLEAHFDLLQNSLVTRVADELGDRYLYVSPKARVEAGARVVPPAHVGDGVVIEAGARVGPLAVVGRDSRIGRGAHVVESVLQEEVAVGPGAVVERSVLVRRAAVGGASHLSNVVVGEACRIGADNVLANGLCLYPDVVLPDGSVKFRELEGRETSQGGSVSGGAR
jgi:mannose-1-phosphate guanylyltransferase